ncbi:DUF2066 domain-containing protein [Photobacterium minamisatsumaniensis]|uniref:DUF2066 domain-containing protein n=1 Tax=Photobacterium minamisatsumaniensis TaxID=2910233 RepID=UPI003D10F91E
MLRVALLFMVILALPLKAATVTNLYQAQVILPDTDRQSEQAARNQALQQVLIKVSGQSGIIQNEVIAKAIKNSSQYVSQFGYGNLDGQQTLDLTFDRARIRNLLTQAGSTLWGEQRPNVLIWLVEDANRSRNIVWDQSSNALLQDVKRASDVRGLPVMLPIGDFEDVTAISIPDLWGGFIQPISSASLRYQPDAIVVARSRQMNDGSVQLGWQLFAEKADRLATAQLVPVEGRIEATKAEAITQMVGQITDHLAAKYAVPLGGDNSGLVSVVVDNIQSSEDFFTLERMMTNLTSVAAVNAHKIQGQSVEFTVQLLSTEDAFQRELSQDRRLSSAMPVAAEDTQASEVIEAEEEINSEPTVEGMIRATQLQAPESTSKASQPIDTEGVSISVPDVENSSSEELEVAPVNTRPAKQAQVFHWTP